MLENTTCPEYKINCNLYQSRAMIPIDTYKCTESKIGLLDKHTFCVWQEVEEKAEEGVGNLRQQADGGGFSLK